MKVNTIKSINIMKEYTGSEYEHHPENENVLIIKNASANCIMALARNNVGLRIESGVAMIYSI